MATPAASCAVLAIILMIVLQLRSFASACSGRHIYNSSSGVITSGLGDYPASANCEWLIIAGKHKFISLEFLKMVTECSYDYMFVYDGASYNSPLLGTFSGSTLPSTVVAKSGSMLVYFFSDRNYVLQGFHARYSVTDCPLNCSGHGECHTGKQHVCICFAGYVGSACEMPLCAELCQDNGGYCSNAACVCPAGQIGYDCGLNPSSTSQVGYWSQLLPTGGSSFPARTGHAGVMVNDCLYIFGGTTLNRVLSDLVVYCVGDLSSWRSVVRTSPWPTGRFGHDMAVVDGALYMFGGVLSNGSYSNELWSYTIDRGQWKLMAVNTKRTSPPAMTGHTLTAIDDNWLYAMGGRTSRGAFVSHIYRVRVGSDLNDTVWFKVESVGGKRSARRFVGHSAVFHAESRAILVFGGFWPEYARFPRRSTMLLSYQVDANHWSEMSYDATLPAVPRERAFHRATILGNYMVIHGGQVHLHHEDETCYDQQIYLYHLGCHVWVDYLALVQAFQDQLIAERPMSTKGRYGHVLVSVFNNTLLVAGGYCGSVLDDLVATTVPISIAKSSATANADDDYCNSYSIGSCAVDPECFWCGERVTTRSPGCVHLSHVSDCNGGVHSSGCPGICSVLKTCDACTVHGMHASTTLRGLPFNDDCFWCVKESQCQRSQAPGGVCSTSRNTTSGVEGWWGGMSPRLTSLRQCYTDDMPAGLHWIRYRHPANFSMPDEVDIVRSASQTFQFNPVFDGENIVDTHYVAVFKGFIHCSRAFTTKQLLKVYLVAAAAHAYLFVSKNSTPGDKEMVASLDLSTFGYMQAKRPDESSLFPQWPDVCKLYVEEQVVQTVAGRYNTQVASTMQLDWTGALKSAHTQRQTITAEFLEPFSSADGDSCSINYSTCLACSTDTACGWCDSETIESCISRTSSAVDNCVAGLGSMILVPSHCPVCADHVDCTSCVQDETCEWLTAEARCLRRGRFESAVKELSSCPTPCLERTNLTWCIGDHNECAWCEQTQLCFAFFEYVPRFPYGGCRHWTDGVSGVNVNSDSCSQSSDCQGCLGHFTCGWCYNVDNPTIGVCQRGDFTGPYVAQNCSALIATEHSVNAPASWSYASCPDVDECRLGIHNCSVDASCHNTIDSFHCTCVKGFAGDGVTVCNRTCYEDCVVGSCSGWPNYTCVCNTGWTGLDCSTDCGCNNHSTCSNAVGQCDSCLDWTAGSHCQLCQSGSYGNATLKSGCKPCDCNGHGDVTKGVCDTQTGQCYCIHNTRGCNCEHCIAGQYGDPRSGGQCYSLCDGRTIISNVTSMGGLGSYHGRGADNRSQIYCLWILSTFSSLEGYGVSSHRVSRGLPGPNISLTMQTDLNDHCSQGYVIIYDGIPSFPGFSTAGATLLGVFCGLNARPTRAVTATSGFMSIFYEAYVDPGSLRSGFNATYGVSQCDEVLDCSQEATCQDGVCICDDGQPGYDCSPTVCPLNCSARFGHGFCHKFGFCMCSSGYGGRGCTVKQSTTSAVSSLVAGPHNYVLPRVGHSLVSCADGSGTVYLFGGYVPGRGPTNDLWKYSTVDLQWDLIRPISSIGPSARYHHAAVCVPSLRALFVFGGIVEQSSVSQELWKFGFDTDSWVKVVSAVSHAPQAMAGHSMTRAEGDTIWIIGGFSPSNYFIEPIYVLELKEDKVIWSEVNSQLGTKPIGLFGHSAVYHEPSHSIYVHGGYEYLGDLATVSSNLYALLLGDKPGYNATWSLLTSDSGNRPSARYFHGSVSTDQYMVVLGGYSLDGSIDASVLIYRFACNHWTNITALIRTADDFVDQTWAFHTAGQTAVTADGSIYQLTGWMTAIGNMKWRALVRLNLPSDSCGLNKDENSCINSVGCATCTVLETQRFFCYSNTGSRPSGCLVENTSIAIQHGTMCDAHRLDAVNCSQYRTCSECLVQWPSFHDQSFQSRSCQWCARCSPGRCVPFNADCDTINPCSERQQRIISSTDCLERQCLASDCDKCATKGNCIWTRQVKRTSERIRVLNLFPKYNWNCVTKVVDGLPYKIESSPLSKCPSRCHQHVSCSSCLSSRGGEGGSHECAWSTVLSRCLAPVYVPLLCSAGECGLVTFGNDLQCPLPCRLNTQCATCLASPRCGWCALGSLNGRGLCMEGGPGGPVAGICSNTTVLLHNDSLSDNVVGWVQQARPPNIWAFTSCPLENECMNGHHSCGVNEQCIDAIDGFSCECKHGFSRNRRNICEPLCEQGCQHGICVLPNMCQCNFGYVGANCTSECLCNKHSNCASVTERSRCLLCHNNTVGDHCERCKPLFIGNPQNGGRCQSCSDLCNSHSQVCLTKDEQSRIQKLPVDSSHLVKNGPLEPSSAVCIECGNNTQGIHCQECKDGYFRLKGRPLSEPCQICQCNGHSDVCDKERGENCDCKNNTRSQRCESGENTKPPCWKFQCSQCLDSFLGTPTQGHQCYRQMSIDTGLCFDPVNQKNCNPATAQPNPLYANRTVFFAVQPKYLNVDIRIILDVTKGAVTLYFAPFDNVFVVTVDPLTGVHRVSIDPIYKYSASHDTNIGNEFVANQWRRRRRDVGSSVGDSVEDADTSTFTSSNSSTIGIGAADSEEPDKVYQFVELTARQFVTYVAVPHPDTFLVVRNVRDRLVIMLPNAVHQLKVSRFYLVIAGAVADVNGASFGMVYFRQDQPHIDLFVFFSVFFSCFFLFLAVCVLLWKAKQVVDTRRTHLRRQIEMQCMASRPFARALVYFGSSSRPILTLSRGDEVVTTLTRMRTSSKQKHASVGAADEAPFNVNPIALEPTNSGSAVVATFVVELPCSTVAPVQVCLGSCLLMPRVVYASSVHHTSMKNGSLRVTRLAVT